MTAPPAQVEAPDKAYEMRLRRAAQRWGLALHRCPRRNPNSPGFGTYELKAVRYTESHSQYALVFGDPEHGFGRTLPQVEAYLASLAARHRAKYEEAS